MNDERLGKEIGAFYRETDVTPPDSHESAREVAARLGSTPQVKRRRWLPAWRPRTSRPAEPDQAPVQPPSPIPASNGHTPTVIGRTTSMFSPVKAITAGAIVFAIGGAFLIAQPFDRQSGTPAAEAEAFPTPDRFISTYTWSGLSTAGSSETVDGDIRVVTGEGWLFDFGEASDPRFAGPLVLTSNVVHHPDQGNLTYGGYRIETDDGAWQQVPVAGLRFEEDLVGWRNGSLPPADNIQFGTFVGEGEYEGLIAVFQETWWPAGTAGLLQLDGWVIDGDLPDAPEPWLP